ncbi:hypothetical protein H4219_003327 [Mycoemilia scoparia]|uniref:Ran-binding protein 9 n=1 Tax=Mycoemilia scoparia TaxID=417184 RepID=A0A9W8DPF2_9FUNG|nr:hypothetical protein H4219_003327 [Mycoemilia scoparia]
MGGSQYLEALMLRSFYFSVRSLFVAFAQFLRKLKPQNRRRNNTTTASDGDNNTTNNIGRADSSSDTFPSSVANSQDNSAGIIPRPQAETALPNSTTPIAPVADASTIGGPAEPSTIHNHNHPTLANPNNSQSLSAVQNNVTLTNTNPEFPHFVEQEEQGDRDYCSDCTPILASAPTHTTPSVISSTQTYNTTTDESALAPILFSLHRPNSSSRRQFFTPSRLSRDLHNIEERQRNHHIISSSLIRHIELSNNTEYINSSLTTGDTQETYPTTTSDTSTEGFGTLSGLGIDPFERNQVSFDYIPSQFYIPAFQEGVMNPGEDNTSEPNRLRPTSQGSDSDLRQGADITSMLNVTESSRQDEAGPATTLPGIRSPQFPGWSMMAHIATRSPPPPGTQDPGSDNSLSEPSGTAIVSMGLPNAADIVSMNILQNAYNSITTTLDYPGALRWERLHRHVDEEEEDDDDDDDRESGSSDDNEIEIDDDDDDDDDDMDEDDFSEGRDEDAGSVVIEDDKEQGGSTSNANNDQTEIPKYLEDTAFASLMRRQDEFRARQNQVNNPANDISQSYDSYSSRPDDGMFNATPDLDPMGTAARLSMMGESRNLENTESSSGLGGYWNSGNTSLTQITSQSTHQRRISQSLLYMWKSQEKKKQTELSLPTQWNPKDKSTNLCLDPSGLLVTYVGPGKSDSDSGMVRTNNPMSPQCGIYYFEIEIITRGQNGFIGIGFSTHDAKLDRLPGWDKNSWGYHGDDGHVFINQNLGRPFGPRFSTGDIIGCGINFMNNSGFYTRNGVYLGTAFQNIDLSTQLYPTIGMRTPSEKASANFGSKPFLFDIALYVKEQLFVVEEKVYKAPIDSLLLKSEDGVVLEDRKDDKETSNDVGAHLKRQRSASRYKPVVLGKLPIPTKPFGNDVNDKKGTSSSSNSNNKRKVAAGPQGSEENILEVILCYLMHHGYYETARALIVNLLGNSEQDKLSEDKQVQLQGFLNELHNQDKQMQVRKTICDHVRRGEIDAALKLTREHYPRTLDEDGLLLFRLRRWRFIELVRESAGKAILMDDDDEGNETSSAEEDGSEHENNKQPSSRTATTGSGVVPISNGNSARHDVANNSNGLNKALGTASISDMDIEGIEEIDRKTDASEPIDSRNLVATILKEGRKLQAQYSNTVDIRIKKGLDTAFSLMAYSNPLESPVKMLLDPIARDVLANNLNTAILASQSRPQSPSLETMYRQTAAILDQLVVHENDGAAALLRIRRDCLPQTPQHQPQSHIQPQKKRHGRRGSGKKDTLHHPKDQADNAAAATTRTENV